MNSNHSRNEFRLEFVCSECGSHLHFKTVSEDIKRQQFTCNSAFETFLTKQVEPCEGCISKAMEPLNHLKKALSLLEEGLKS